MKSTYQMMNALVTLPPVGVSIKDGEGNTRKSASELRARICAVVPGRGSVHLRSVPIVLSEFSRGGYSEKPWVTGEQIMVPDGYLIVAMLVDEKGKPLNDELLPVELEELPNNDWALNKSAPFRISGDGLAFGGFPGKTSSNLHSASIEGDSRKIVFKAGLFTPVNVTTIPVLTDEMKQAVIDAVRESDLFTSLQAAIAAQAASTVNLQQAVNDAAGDAIRNSLAPGGPIWNSLNR
ncbi:hypothetical protein [Kluyvera sp. CHPC 1.2972]|uniref:hypothetical protein n=1 Tax=Kluyvera sp. CHPC 1.2972 TaxID=2995176 RepID=UPI002FD7CDFA